MIFFFRLMCLCLINCFCFLRMCTLLLIISCVKEPIDARKYWIGLQTHNSPNDFVWSTGEMASYTYWGTGQPDRHTLHSCVFLNGSHHYTWDDDRCSLQFHFICEHVVNIVSSMTNTVTTSTQTKLTGKCQIQTLHIKTYHFDKLFTDVIFIIL